MIPFSGNLRPVIVYSLSIISKPAPCAIIPLSPHIRLLNSISIKVVPSKVITISDWISTICIAKVVRIIKVIPVVVFILLPVRCQITIFIKSK